MGDGFRRLRLAWPALVVVMMVLKSVDSVVGLASLGPPCVYFCVGGEKATVTKRVVDWLVANKVVSFTAMPCRVDVTGMTKSQLRQLEHLISE